MRAARPRSPSESSYKRCLSWWGGRFDARICSTIFLWVLASTKHCLSLWAESVKWNILPTLAPSSLTVFLFGPGALLIFPHLIPSTVVGWHSRGIHQVIVCRDLCNLPRPWQLQDARGLQRTKQGKVHLWKAKLTTIKQTVGYLYWCISNVRCYL
jgi:hypothetical protein